MKKNILVQTGERTETRIRTHPAQYNEMGDLIAEAYDETYTVNVPIMEPRNVEMTALSEKSADRASLLHDLIESLSRENGGSVAGSDESVSSLLSFLHADLESSLFVRSELLIEHSLEESGAILFGVENGLSREGLRSVVTRADQRESGTLLRLLSLLVVVSLRLSDSGQLHVESLNVDVLVGLDHVIDLIRSRFELIVCVVLVEVESFCDCIKFHLN